MCNNGCKKDDTKTQGWWKSQRQIVDSYIGTVLPYPNAKVASVLCIGGAVKYEIKEGSGVTDKFILQCIVPHTTQLMG